MGKLKRIFVETEFGNFNKNCEMSNATSVEFGARQKRVMSKNAEKRNIDLQKSASIQPRTDLPKFGRPTYPSEPPSPPLGQVDSPDCNWSLPGFTNLRALAALSHPAPQRNRLRQFWFLILGAKAMCQFDFVVSHAYSKYILHSQKEMNI